VTSAPSSVFLGSEESIGKGDFLHFIQTFICGQIRVDIERDRHVHFFAGGQCLFCKTETVDLVKIGGRLERGYVKGRRTSYGFFAVIDRPEKYQGFFANLDCDRPLNRLEMPR
jgi:hypothetical protein